MSSTLTAATSPAVMKAPSRKKKSLREHQQTPHFYEGIKKIEALAAHTDVHFIHWLEPGQ